MHVNADYRTLFLAWLTIKLFTMQVNMPIAQTDDKVHADDTGSNQDMQTSFGFVHLRLPETRTYCINSSSCL